MVWFLKIQISYFFWRYYSLTVQKCEEILSEAIFSDDIIHWQYKSAKRSYRRQNFDDHFKWNSRDKLAREEEAIERKEQLFFQIFSKGWL
jgi:uncharacterized membrane protein YgaE (UPF0421/DUF939 family)